MNGGDTPGRPTARLPLSRWLFALGIGCAIAHIAWQCRQSFPLRDPLVPEPAPPDSGADITRQREVGDPSTPALSAVARMHLFGVYRAPDVAAAAPPAVVAETRLDFRLQGVFTSTDADAAAALIAVDGGSPARRFRPGDMLGAQAELVSVALDHVVLRRGAELQRLSLHRVQRAAAPSALPALRHADRMGPRTEPARHPAPLPEASRAVVVMARLRRLRASGG